MLPRVPASLAAQARPVPCAASHARHSAEAEDFNEHEVG